MNTLPWKIILSIESIVISHYDSCLKMFYWLLSQAKWHWNYLILYAALVVMVFNGNGMSSEFWRLYTNIFTTCHINISITINVNTLHCKQGWDGDDISMTIWLKLTLNYSSMTWLHDYWSTRPRPVALLCNVVSVCVLSITPHSLHYGKVIINNSIKFKVCLCINII